MLGYDAKRDVAVLRLDDASGLATATTDTAGVSVGEDVTAVGDAGGDGGALTAAAGFGHRAAPADHRQRRADRGTSRLRNLIEVDADVIPGDSGGALLDSDGDVVGMNVAASSGSANITGYVIPIARVLRVADHVLAGDASGSVTLGYDAFLGVSMGASGADAGRRGRRRGGRRRRAGRRRHDHLARRRTGDAPPPSSGSAVAAHDPGDPVTVTWTDASGTSHSASATLGRAPLA